MAGQVDVDGAHASAGSTAQDYKPSSAGKHLQSMTTGERCESAHSYRGLANDVSHHAVVDQA